MASALDADVARRPAGVLGRRADVARRRAQLLRGLLTGDRAHAGPFFVTLDVTRRCNLRCLGCRYHTTEADLPRPPGDHGVLDLDPALAGELFAQLGARRTQSVLFLGEGEPLLHPDLPRMIADARRHGLHTTVMTNGTLLDAERAGALVAAGVDVLRVTIWEPDPAAAARNNPGTPAALLERAHHGLAQVARRRSGGRRPRLVVHQPVNRHNVASVERTVELARATGCDGVSFSPFLAHRGALAGHELSREELAAALGRAAAAAERAGLDHNVADSLQRLCIGPEVWRRLPCYIAWVHLRVKVDGTVLPCGPCDRVLGDLRRQTLDELFDGDAIRAFRRETMTRARLASLQAECDCGYCCLLLENLKVERVFRFLRPLARRTSPVLRRRAEGDV